LTKCGFLVKFIQNSLKEENYKKYITEEKIKITHLKWVILIKTS